MVQLRATAECFARLSYSLGVRLCVCLSVTLCYCIKTVQARITKPLPCTATITTNTTRTNNALVQRFNIVLLHDSLPAADCTD